jgi:hypothetical protein
MSRSLFAKLHRRFGQRITGEERRRRADAHMARLREAMPVGMVGGPQFAAARAGMAVTVIEPRGSAGGRAAKLDAAPNSPLRRTRGRSLARWPSRARYHRTIAAEI